MAYRKFDTGAWQDPWFESLSPQAKLLFIYLWTNEVCNQAGLYEISKRRMTFEVGFDVDEPMEELSEKVFWDSKKNIVWVKSFFKWQCQNDSFAIGALKQIEDSPYFKEYLVYNTDLLKKYDKIWRKYMVVAGSDDNCTPSGHHADTVQTPSKDHADTVPTPSKHHEDTMKTLTPHQNRTEQNRNNNPQRGVKKPDTQKSVNESPPSGISFKSLKTKLKNKQVTATSKNNGKRLDEYFQKINQACDKIAALPKKRKKFDPYKWAQQQIGKSQHPGAIMESLEGLILFWDSAHDPWAYASNILGKKNGTFNEQDAISYHAELKNMKSSQLEFLTQGLLQEMPS